MTPEEVRIIARQEYERLDKIKDLEAKRDNALNYLLNCKTNETQMKLRGYDNYKQTDDWMINKAQKSYDECIEELKRLKSSEC